MFSHHNVALIFKSFDIDMYIFFLFMGEGEGEGNRIIFKISIYCDEVIGFEVKGSNAIELITITTVEISLMSRK